MEDPALAALVLPFATDTLTWPTEGQALFLRARAGAALPSAWKANLLCRQSFRPDRDALAAAGYTLDDADGEGPFPLVLLLPPRQREESRALLAQALSRVAPGGLLVVSQANGEGARTANEDLERLAGRVDSLSKHKCRVFWTRRDDSRIDAALLAEWRDLDAPRPVAEGRFLSRPGLFAWDRIDGGSALLAGVIPPDLAGQGADLGAGFGYLAAEVLDRCPGVTALHLYEAERRALDLARQNVTGPVEFFWHDVTAGLPQAYDFIVTNPPFHQGRADKVDLGQAFLRVAAAALKPGGRLLLVANRHLPYEATLKSGFRLVHVLADDGAYKVIEAVKAKR